jgi:hypothetical protein
LLQFGSYLAEIYALDLESNYSFKLVALYFVKYILSFRKSHPLVKILNSVLVDLPAPANLSIN